MTCPDITDLWLATDGLLPPAHMLAVHTHITQCETCRQSLAEADALIQKAADLLRRRPWWRRAWRWVLFRFEPD